MSGGNTRFGDERVIALKDLGFNLDPCGLTTDNDAVPAAVPVPPAVPAPVAVPALESESEYLPRIHTIYFIMNGHECTVSIH